MSAVNLFNRLVRLQVFSTSQPIFDDEFEHIYLWLPGAQGPDALRIQKGGPGGDRVWGWDGNVDKPTLTPSIHDVDHWHGWLQTGRLVSC